MCSALHQQEFSFLVCERRGIQNTKLMLLEQLSYFMFLKRISPHNSSSDHNRSDLNMLF